MKNALIPISQITIPDDVERDTLRVDDDLLAKSIQHGGIQQPLVVLETGKGRYTLIDGLRRIRAAVAVDITKVPVVVDVVPKGQTVEDYCRQIRFILDTHRQDLLPSQKAELIETLKTTFGLNSSQVAAYLGIDPDTVTNVMALKKLIPAVVDAIDSGRLTMQKSRVFAGMSELGQQKVWKAHQKELTTISGGKLHKELRAKYPPEAFPSYYKDAPAVAQKLARKSGKRKSAARLPVVSKSEKAALLNSVEMKEIELRDAQEELKSLKTWINASIPIVSAIMRNPKLLELVPDDMVDELSRFEEIYC